MYVQLHTKGVKSGANKIIGHVNEAIQSEKLESINATTRCADKDK